MNLPRRRVLTVVAVAVTGLWVGINVVSAYAAANPWLTAVVWRPPDHSGALAAAVPGADIDTAAVVGRHVPAAPGRGTVVVVHGYDGDRDQPAVVTAARWLHDAGYGVLAIDLGYLDGRHRYSAGHREAADISAAIDWLDHHDETLAGVWGFSAGAHAALIATARDPRIPAVIADSAFVDGEAQIRRIAAATWKIPASGFLLVGTALDVFSGDAPTDLRSLTWPGTPTLVVHGEADEAVPFSNAAMARDHTGATLLALPNVGHVDAHTDAPDRYRTAALDLLGDATASAPHPD